MTTLLSQRIQQVKPSATLAVSTKAAELRAAGKEIIALSVGEPDFDTPQHIKEAAIQAIHDGLTKYTPVAGTPSLKQAIITKFSRDNQLSYAANQILVSCGAKHSIYNVMQALLNKDDEVVIPAPYWTSYPDMALLAEATPVIITANLEDDFKITPDQLAQALTKKTRLFMLNSPSNPSGMSYSHAELVKLGEVLNDYPQVIILTDDIYEHIRWEKQPFVNIINACPHLYDRTVVINGVSKAYAMTGWRIGYAAGPEPIIKAMAKIQSQSTSGPCSIAQKAAEVALVSDQACLKEMVNAFKERHDTALKLMNTIPGFECRATDGTFYLFPRVQQCIDNMADINDDIEFAEYLLQHAGVAVVPGAAFGMPGYLRFSIALSSETFSAAVDKIKQAL